MAKGSPSVGQSGLAGESEFSGKADQAGAYILKQVLQFHERVINRGILEWHKSAQAIGRQEIRAWEEFKVTAKELERAKDLAEKGSVRDAMENIRSAYQDYCYDPNVPEADKLQVSKIFADTFPQLLDDENLERRAELEKMCDQAIAECEKKGIDSDAWHEFKDSVEQAYENAKHKTPMAMTMVRCRSNLLNVARDNLLLAGVNSKIFYEPTERYGYIVVPSAGGVIEQLAHAAVIDAAVKSAQANILSEESMDMVMQLRGIDDRMEMTGLTMSDAEAVMESLYGKNAPIVIKEPESHGNNMPRGGYSIIYSKKDEQLVNSVVLQSMLQKEGAGLSAHMFKILETNYLARQGADLLLTKLAEGHDTFGYVVDADHPEHHLLITKEGITETFENGEKDFVKFDQIPNPTNYSIEVKERIMQLAPRVQFFPAKVAKECGLTQDDFIISDELKKALVVRNPKNTVRTVDMGNPEATKEYAREVQFAMAAQTMYGRYAAEQARIWLPKDADLQTVVQYVAQNTKEFLSGFKRQLLDNVEKRHLGPEEKEKALQDVDLAIKTLKTRGKDEGKDIESAIGDVYKRVITNQWVQVHNYQSPKFTAMELGNKSIDGKDLAEFRKDIARADSILNYYREEAEKTTKADNNEHAVVRQETQQTQRKQPAKLTREEIVAKNENTVRAYTQQLSVKLSPEKAEAIAVCNVFMNNMKSALLDQQDLPPADQYIQMYHIIPEQEAVRIDHEVQNRYGINLEQYEHMPDDQKDQYRPHIEAIIKDDVQKAVSRGMKEKSTQHEMPINRDDER